MTFIRTKYLVLKLPQWKSLHQHDLSLALLFAWLLKFSFVPPANSHKPARKLSFSSGERSKPDGEHTSERRSFRVPLTRDFSRLPQNGIEIVSGLICLLFIDFYNLFRMFPDFSLLLQNIPRITDLHVTCSCRSSPLSQSLVLLGKWIFSILNNETLPIFLHGVKSPANSPQ